MHEAIKSTADDTMIRFTPFRPAVFALLVCLACLALRAAAQPLEGTKPLEEQGDLASKMVDSIHRFVDRETAESVEKRAAYWHRDLSSPEKYAASVEPNREHLAKILGVVDERVKDTSPKYIAGPGKASLVGRGEGYEIRVVRWEALSGVNGEGLLVIPTKERPAGDLVLLGDADQTPEMLVGLDDDAKADTYRFALRAAEMNCRILIPTLVNRADTYSVAGNGVRPTNQPHREFVYRPAFEVGRHVIGYEVQKILAAIDWFAADRDRGTRRISVMGYGEGGLLALYAGALDTRIDHVGVSGYFGRREELWREPIYRNVQGLLKEFGDAEVASLLAPRKLLVDGFAAPRVDGPPSPHDSRAGAAPGRIASPGTEEIDSEIARLAKLTPAGWKPDVDLGRQLRFPFESSDRRPKPSNPVPISSPPPARVAPLPDAGARQKRQIDEMQAFTQMLVRKSERVRRALWSKPDRSSPAKWEETTKSLREHFYNDVIGKFDQPLLAANPRTRKLFDEPKYVGYEVMIDVFPDVFASGILLVPKDLKPDERRPVVVCQHGLEGRPSDVADPKVDSQYYHRFACRLAEQGFVTYAPQNPYIGEDRFRSLQRKLNPLGKQLYSIIIPQHQQTLNWLSTLPFVDSTKIAFYGLSYGGTTAMRVPAVETRYCLSICSGDFNEWIWKNTSLDYPNSYVGTREYEIFEWDLANTFNYAEMAGLIAPRPFMVERGHHDAVGLDEWVGYEYGKVRLLYAELGIPQQTRIEYFLGPHEIHGVGTFEFLREKLNWPKSPSH
jgi:dienelactone hydrolase